MKFISFRHRNITSSPLGFSAGCCRTGLGLASIALSFLNKNHYRECRKQFPFQFPHFYTYWERWILKVLKESSQYNKTQHQKCSKSLYVLPVFRKPQFNIGLSPLENPLYQTVNTFLYILTEINKKEIEKPEQEWQRRNYDKTNPANSNIGR